MGKHEEYWNGLEQYNADSSFQKTQKDEFQEDLPMEDSLSEESLGLKSNRRDFLKIFGFGLTAAALTACVEKPVRKAVPYVNKPENVTPGRAEWYATTASIGAGIGILVKSREGRPIKVEGNRMHKLNKGGCDAIVEASLLNLYDSNRLKVSRGPSSKMMKWGAVDNEIMSKLESLGSGAKILLVGHSDSGLASKRLVQKFKAKYPGTKSITYDPVSNYALAKVHSDGGEYMQVPGYHFEKAKVIVGLDADFLGSWISPTEYTKGYAKGRKVSERNPTMSRHIHFEPRMSLTGSNADLRVPMKPAQLMAAIAGIHEGLIGGAITWKGPGNAVQRAVRELRKAGSGNSLVVCGVNDVHAQTVVKAINEILGNYGSTIDMDRPSYQVQGNDEHMVNFVAELSHADAVIFLDEANPVYDFREGTEVAKVLPKVGLSVAFVSKENETSKLCQYGLAQTHWLEEWGDAQPRKGYFGIRQPLVRPLYDSRSWQDTLMVWSGDNRRFYDLIREVWENEIYPRGAKQATFRSFWNDTVRDGFFEADVHGSAHATEGAHHAAQVPAEHAEDEEAAAAPDHASAGSPLPDPATSRAALLATYNKNKDTSEFVIYLSTTMGTGRYANNPWLQEYPDPITKVTWDNYICVPYVNAKQEGWSDGDIATLKVGGKSVDLPIIVQPGQAANTYAIKVGYGRGDIAGKVAKGVGKNVYPMVGVENGSFSYVSQGASVTPKGENIRMAKTQTFIGYELMSDGEGGDGKRKEIENRVGDYIVKETTLSAYRKSRVAGNKRPSGHHMLSLWNIHDKKGHHWAMAIDLNACTGCGSCIVSCNVENNIATVGREEVANRREMHWLRIDRYYKGDPADQEGKLEMVHQPMMCQQCDNAPCETVCPVLATVHSDEGLNQQVYNRCIGTRYCANNCPYKVRRFNWFSYYWNDDFKDVNVAQHDKIGRLVLNPDVTVRARGVMEKCSFCVQRIQDMKLKAKVEGRKLNDEDMKTACGQSCPADAVVFGDLNDTSSEIYKLYHNKRGYHALEDVKTLPSVLYLTKVRNRGEDESENPTT
ncbi:MAG: TAT-variant-translocated molybdopterin oxidoreductase [Bacteroidota bacterium]